MEAEAEDASNLAGCPNPHPNPCPCNNRIALLFNPSWQVEVEDEDVSDLAGRLQQMGVRLQLVKLYCQGGGAVLPC